MKTLLFVDDDPDVLSTLKRSFRRGFKVLSASNGEEAKIIIADQPLQLIICDQRMPGITGDQVLLYAAEVQPDAIRILLTGYADMESLITCVNEAQIYKYVSKPWEPEDLRLTVVRALESYDLKKELEKTHLLLEKAYHNAVRMLCMAAEGKDENTASHLYRVQYYTEALALKAGVAIKEAEQMGVMSMLHDIGKLAVPDAILQKPGKLTEQEWEVMREHPLAGARILGDNPFYQLAREISAGHHENYDGSGYPKGLQADEIPLSAQIVKIADVFDALTTTRPYKEAWTMEKAIDYMSDLKGIQFSPSLMELFVELYQSGELLNIQNKVMALQVE